ncbi:hypothetical protein NNL21_06185 [Paenibacillus mendelii]|nr:hypothetical protein [Paenibacillus mendelii]
MANFLTALKPLIQVCADEKENMYEPLKKWIYKLVSDRFYELYQGHRDKVSA